MGLVHFRDLRRVLRQNVTIITKGGNLQKILTSRNEQDVELLVDGLFICRVGHQTRSRNRAQRILGVGNVGRFDPVRG